MSSSVSANQILAWVSEANRAPSVHNVQPARWAWESRPDGSAAISLYSDQTRRLPASDPLRLDEGTSLGAAWEGLRLALARSGWVLNLEEWLDPGISPSHRGQPELKLIARGNARLDAQALTRDDLMDWVFKRKTFRGKFLPAIPSQLSLLEAALESSSFALLRGPRSLEQVARLCREATSRIAGHAGVQRELLQWLRFSRSHRRYYEDGLNAEALGVSGPLARMAEGAMRASSHPLALKTGINQLLLDESAQIKSASAILVLFVSRDADAVTRGRHLYRTWLRLTQLGLSACPMSVLSDDPEIGLILKNFHSAPGTVNVLNVLRIGVSPQPILPLTPRLQPENLLAI